MAESQDDLGLSIRGTAQPQDRPARPTAVLSGHSSFTSGSKLTLLVRPGLEQVFGRDCPKVKDGRQARLEYSTARVPRVLSLHKWGIWYEGVVRIWVSDFDHRDLSPWAIGNMAEHALHEKHRWGDWEWCHQLWNAGPRLKEPRPGASNSFSPGATSAFKVVAFKGPNVISTP